jgi:predicted nucleic acid-binding protein
VTYADTSALLKLLVVEEESAELIGYLSETDRRLSSSDLSVAELLRTATRSGATPHSARALLGQIDLLALRRDSLVRAGNLPSPHGTFLRTADAIHLVAALELEETVFLTYDRRQAQAANQQGFEVATPGRPEGWFTPPSS